jgi:hypothetical protein
MYTGEQRKLVPKRTKLLKRKQRRENPSAYPSPFVKSVYLPGLGIHSHIHTNELSFFVVV